MSKQTNVALVFDPGTTDPTLPTLGLLVPLGIAREDDKEYLLPQEAVVDVLCRLLLSMYATEQTSPEQALAYFTSTVLTSVRHEGIRVVSPAVFPLGTDFAVRVRYEHSPIMVGDTLIDRPEFHITTVRPVMRSLDTYTTNLYWPTGQSLQECHRGVLVLKTDQGRLCVGARTGWLGSHDVVAHIKRKFEAALLTTTEVDG